MKLITQIEVYSPQYIGKQDVLIAGGKIEGIFPKLDTTKLDSLPVELIDGKDKILVPGFIDAHVHIAGAGGEGGPGSRTPEIQLSQLIEGGVTSVVGCLGTDGMTRSLSSVLMKVKALRAQGISAWMYTGAYQVPPPSFFGDSGKDIALIEEVIGLGEVALSDHRSSVPTTDELVKLVEHARVGGMLGGKAGLVNIHMGDAHNPFQPIYDALNASELPITQFYPTHCNRNGHIFEDAKTYGKQGFVDLTSSSYPYFPDLEIKPSKAIRQLLEANVPLAHITMTSDANGSLPDFDEKGNLRKLEMGHPVSMLQELRDAVLKEKVPLDQALQVITQNPAAILKLAGKGRLSAGSDADMLILNKDMELLAVIAQGELMMLDGKQLVKGAYES